MTVLQLRKAIGAKVVNKSRYHSANVWAYCLALCVIISFNVQIQDFFFLLEKNLDDWCSTKISAIFRGQESNGEPRSNPYGTHMGLFDGKSKFAWKYKYASSLLGEAVLQTPPSGSVQILLEYSLTCMSLHYTTIIGQVFVVLLIMSCRYSKRKHGL